MKILFIQNESSKSFYGGVEYHVKNIRSKLDDHCVESLEISFDNLKGFRIFGHKLFLPKKLLSIILNINPDIIHLHGVSSTIVMSTFYYIKRIKTLINVKFIYTPHFHPFKFHKRPTIAKFFFNYFIKKNIKYVDKLVCLTYEEKKYFINIFNQKKISIIPNGINMDSGDHNFKIKNKIKTFIYVGRSAHNKNLDFILNLFRKSMNSNFNLNVITDKYYKNEKNITFNNNISKKKLNELYLKSDVLLVPSSYEAFSIVCLEAMKYGLLLIISEKVMIKTYLKKMNFCKILQLNSNHWQKHLCKLNELNQSKINTLSRESYLTVKKFDWNVIKKQLFKLYEI